MPNGKFIIFRCPKIWSKCSLIIMCSYIRTPNNHHFPFGTNGKVVVLGVPILKHFRVDSILKRLSFAGRQTESHKSCSPLLKWQRKLNMQPHTFKWFLFYPQALQELQGKMITTTQQLKVSDAQIETLKRSIQHSTLVEKELSRLPENTRVYEGVGRM